MKNNLPRFLSLLFYLIACLFPVTTYAFSDNFDSEDSLAHYTIDNNGGSVMVDGGDLIISSPGNNKKYPYVRLLSSSVSLPITSLEIRFKYESLGLFGAGIVIDDNYPNNGYSYDVGHQSILWTWNWGAPPTLKLGRYPFNYSIVPNYDTYHTIRISGIPGMYDVYMDDVFQGSTTTTKDITSVWFGNPEVVNTTSGWPTIHIDYLLINDGDDESMLPYYSQLDPMWASEIYDNADEWATPGQDTIGRWGCAITSVAMILKNYDINMPTGEVVEPKLLNTWLGSQPDGYVGGGLLNWLAISRLARQSRLAGHGEIDLEFVKSTGDASSELTDGHYPILDTFGHFVIAYDQDDTTYSVNDPLTPDDHTQPKSEPLASINTYLPSDTDLSYIMLVTDPDIDLSLPNSQTFIESLVDDISGTTIQKKVVYLQTPTLGDYILDVTDHQSGDQIEVYLYDKLGNVSVDTLQLTSSNPASFVIEYNPDSSDNTVRVNTESILTYLKSLRMPKSPFNGIMQSIYSKFVEYTNNLREGLDTSVIVNDLLKFLSRQSPKHISVETKQAIQNYIMLIEAN